MIPLERELTALHPLFPAAPDVEARVLARIAGRRRARRRLVLALAAACLVALASAFAVTPARTAVLDWLGLGGVSIERVPSLPPAYLRTSESFGDPVEPSRARDAVDFPVLLPRLRGLGDPHAYLDRDAPSPIVTAVYGDPARPRILLSEWRGDAARHFGKLVGLSTRIVHLRVGGGPGVWVEGPPHDIYYLASDGSFARTPVLTTGNVLIWLRDGVTYRLEVDGPLATAQRIARSLR